MLRERVNPSRRRLLAEQIVAVVVLGCGKKVDAMWHVHMYIFKLYIAITDIVLCS